MLRNILVFLNGVVLTTLLLPRADVFIKVQEAISLCYKEHKSVAIRSCVYGTEYPEEYRKPLEYGFNTHSSLHYCSSYYNQIEYDRLLMDYDLQTSFMAIVPYGGE